MALISFSTWIDRYGYFLDAVDEGGSKERQERSSGSRAQGTLTPPSLRQGWRGALEPGRRIAAPPTRADRWPVRQS